MKKQHQNTSKQGDIVVTIHAQGVNNMFVCLKYVFPRPETANTISSAVSFPCANIHYVRGGPDKSLARPGM